MRRSTTSCTRRALSPPGRSSATSATRARSKSSRTSWMTSCSSSSRSRTGPARGRCAAGAGTRRVLVGVVARDDAAVRLAVGAERPVVLAHRHRVDDRAGRADREVAAADLVERRRAPAPARPAGRRGCRRGAAAVAMWRAGSARRRIATASDGPTRPTAAAAREPAPSSGVGQTVSDPRAGARARRRPTHARTPGRRGLAACTRGRARRRPARGHEGRDLVAEAAYVVGVVGAEHVGAVPRRGSARRAARPSRRRAALEEASADAELAGHVVDPAYGRRRRGPPRPRPRRRRRDISTRSGGSA